METNNQDEFDNNQLNDEDTWLDRMPQINIQQRLLDANLLDYPVARWHFYTKEETSTHGESKHEWQFLWNQSIKILEQFAKIFGSYSAKMTVWNKSPFKDIPSIENRSHFEGLCVRVEHVEQLAPFVFEQLGKHNFNPSDIVIIFSIGGFVRFNKEDVWYPNLFEFRIGYGIEIVVRNFVFLPNHPITRQKQYELWAENAPRLAQCINVTIESLDFELDTDWDKHDYGGYDKENNVGFLYNRRLDGVEWDEFYIPYELIKTVE